MLGGVLIAATAFPPPTGRAAGRSPNDVIEQFYAAYAALNVEKLLALLTDDCFFEDPTFHLVARGKPEISKMAESLPRHYSDVKINVENKILCRDWVITQQSLSGVFKRSADDGGEGRRFSVRGASIFGFAKGKINRWFDYYDYDTYVKQTRSKASG
jgi:steroid delta-isomerase-like uncharacterized protein